VGMKTGLLSRGREILREEGILSFLVKAFLHLVYLVKKVRGDRKMCVGVCEENLIDVGKVLDEVKIKFWLYNGTFLGAYRDGALIPYDSDVDLAIYSEDFKYLVSLEYVFNKMGFKLESPSYNKVVLFRGGEQIDIDFFEVKGGKRVCGLYRCDLSAFEILNEVSFLGRNWRIFSEPERWLEYLYGEDWRMPIKGKRAYEGKDKCSMH